MSKSQPTILQIIPELDTGGAELSTVEIASAICRAGGKALVVSEGGRLASQLAEAGGKLVFFPAATKNPVKIFWNARRLKRMIINRRVDLVHARSRAPAWSALMAARWSNVPFVTTYHGAYNENGRLKKFYNSVMARGDTVIANSRYTSDLIEARYGTPARNLRVIYRGVDGHYFDPDAISDDRVEALRTRWNVNEDDRIILHAARLTSWKGQTVVIEATKQLMARRMLGQAVVVLAGDAQGRSAYFNALERQIADAGLSDAVRLVGHVDDMPAAFKAAYMAVVASSEPEAFGRAATEAQVMGCPVIATDIGAPPETVKSRPHVPADQMTGWLVPPSDPDLLADAIEEGLNMDDEARLAMGRRARAHVLTSFSLDSMKRKTLGVYDDLLGSRLLAAYSANSGE